MGEEHKEIVESIHKLDKSVTLMTAKLEEDRKFNSMSFQKISEKFIHIGHILEGNGQVGVLREVQELKSFKERCAERRRSDKKIWFAIVSMIIGLVGKIVYDGYIYAKLLVIGQ